MNNMKDKGIRLTILKAEIIREIPFVLKSDTNFTTTLGPFKCFLQFRLSLERKFSKKESTKVMYFFPAVKI